ncbi:MAG: segregation and condensation protein A [Planctomycetota bacterium]
MIAPNEPENHFYNDPEPAPEFRVRLEDVFSGPLDLLLHLVREHEVEVTEVSIARVADDFLKYVRALAQLDLAIVGDYLVVAATLLAMKSRSLIPNAEPVDLGEEIEPGDDLIKRLLQYRRVREASKELGYRSNRRELLFSRGSDEMAPKESDEIDLTEVGVWDLLAAFTKVLREVGIDKDDPSHRIGTPDRPVSSYVKDVAEALLKNSQLPFESLFEGKNDRGTVIGTFLAVLELAKQGAIKVQQEGAFGQIFVARALEDTDDFIQTVDAILLGSLDEIPAAEAEPETAGAETEQPVPAGDEPESTAR